MSPVRSATLFGREADVDALAALVGEHRLVTIAGPGGVGKTALANALASELTSPFGPATCKVELVSLTEGRQILPALVTALKAAVGAATAREAVVKALAGGPRLLLIDNCEHLLPHVAELASSLLADLPELHLLLTSQEALNLQAERVYRLGTLAVPAPDAPLEAARSAGAVALLVDRATAADQAFRLSDANLAQVVEICRQLSGLPLAIELAAARLRALGVEGLRTRLGDRLHLLTHGPRDLPERHRTLRAALEWSHALLSPAEQKVFHRLGVMSGTFDLAAIESVAADSGLDKPSLVDAVDGLCAKSLLVTTSTPSGEARFQLLETMRHFALDHLRAEGAEDTARDRHLAHFEGLAESASALLAGPQQGLWLERLDLDRDNLLAAHRRCDHSAEGVERGLRLANALMRYWFNRGALLQGQQVVGEAIARPGVEHHGGLYAQGLLNSGRLFAFRGLDRDALQQYERAIPVARDCGALAVTVESLSRMGYALMGLDDRKGARTALEEARELARDLPDDQTLARAVAFSNLAELERLEGRYEIAAPLYEETLSLNTRRGDRQATMIALNNLAMMALALGEWGAVRDRLRESLRICDELDSRRGRLVAMEVCAGLAADLGQSSRAVFFDATARHHTVAMGRRRDVVDEAFLGPRLERAQRALAASVFAAEEARARASEYAAAVHAMQDWLGALPARVVPGESPAADAAASVTTREREVASLIARGLRNDDIARLLDISVLTVRTHRQRLMEKLELQNAAEITAHAVKMGWYDPS